MATALQSDKGTSFSGIIPMKKGANFPDLSSPVVMGILNVTPDSFFDGGKYVSEKAVLQRVEEMLDEGAAIIDIGGSSTRPGAAKVSRDEEWKRIGPLLIAVRKNFGDACLSVDTYYSLLAERALDLGADMINDISGGTFDPGMPVLIGKRNVPYVIMHIQGKPGNMQQDPQYEDVVEDIASYFEERINTFTQHGANRLILDPGFGFGKTLAHNYALLNKLERFKAFAYPVLAGISRKSMIDRVIGGSPADALNGTSVLNTIALLNGANILRVHDVREAVEAVKLVGSVKSDI